MDKFAEALAKYVDGCKAISEKHRLAHYPLNQAAEWRVDELKRYVRLVQDSGAHSFVARETGDVLKAASWAAPAKHARGNIYDASNGLSRIGPYGPAYLRG